MLINYLLTSMTISQLLTIGGALDVYQNSTIQGPSVFNFLKFDNEVMDTEGRSNRFSLLVGQLEAYVMGPPVSNILLKSVPLILLRFS
jgi:hypothetical protein